MDKILFKQIDNTGLVLWRVVFGLLITIQAFGEIALGSAKRNFIDPTFTFNFIGFEFLQPLPGNGMYFFFAVMGIFGILITIGYQYRIAMVSFAIMWSSVYLMQKTSYNNHYYLMMLLCWVMAFLPANRWLSFDAKTNPKLRSFSMGQWVKIILIAQVWIVFTYAAVAKMYPDWFNGISPALLMKGKIDYWFVGDLLQESWVHYSIAYFGIFFDLCIIPLLVFKRTRILGFVLSIFFHLFNSIIFQIGIFPYMSIAFAFFFFSSETLIKQFRLKRAIYSGDKIIAPSFRKIGIVLFSVYFIFQIGLPVRHWFIADDVLWTEEGHRLSWRMMLRSRSGQLICYVEDKATGKKTKYPYHLLLSKKQARNVRTKPDLIWQLSQKIKQKEAEEGRQVGVYIKCKVKINGGEFYTLIDPNIDIAAEEWSHFKHHDWILPSPKDYHNTPKKE